MATERVLVTPKGRVLAWTARLAATAGMREAVMEDGKLITSQGPAKTPEPTVEAADETPLTAERLDEMGKAELQAYAKKTFGVDLDMRRSAEALRGQVWKLHEDKPEYQKTPGGDYVKDA